MSTECFFDIEYKAEQNLKVIEYDMPGKWELPVCWCDYRNEMNTHD